jgi:hypothetical protein
MKSIMLLLALAIGKMSSAQDLRLFENNWYLTDLVENGTSYLPPINYGSLSFDQQMTMSQANFCHPMTSSVAFAANLTDFSLTDFQPCLCFCSSPTIDAYQDLYYGFFLEGGLSNDFTYAIAEFADERTLTINSMFNKQAVYSSVELSTSHFGKSGFSFYPNPSANLINFVPNNGNTITATVEIYNSLGELCKSEGINPNKTTVETKDLASGIYFVKIKNDLTVSKKLIKL